MQRTIFNPIFNDVCTFVHTAGEASGEYSEMDVTLGPFGGNPLHRHTAFEEIFTVREGILGLTVNGIDVTLRPGQSLVVKKNEAHRFFNAGAMPVKFNLQFVPGHTGAENMLRILYGLAQDGQTNNKGVPKSLTALAVLSDMGNSQLTGLMALLSPLLKLLAARGRRNGVERSLLDKYCSTAHDQPASATL